MSLDPLLRLVHGIPNSLNYNCGPHMGDLKPFKMNISLSNDILKYYFSKIQYIKNNLISIVLCIINLMH